MRFFDEEQIGFYYPHSFFYSQALREGTSLLWNNGYYAGISVPFDQFVSAYFPINRLLFSVLPWIHAHHWSIFIAVLLGCLVAYFFGRSFNLSQSASFILAASYLLSTTFNWLDIGTLAAWSFFMVPALFWAILKVSKGERPLLWTILGGVFISIGFLAGFVQVTIYGYVIAGVFAVYLMLRTALQTELLSVETRFGTEIPKTVGRDQSEAEPRGYFNLRHALGYIQAKNIRVLLSFSIMTILGILLSLPQTLPSLLLVGESIRTTTHALQKFFP